jgi:hypothetical protein
LLIRTRTELEGFNSRLKKYVGASKPNNFKAIKISQQEEVSSSLKYTQTLAGAPILPSRK